MDQTGFTEVELSGTIPKRWAEGESEKGAIEELRRRGREVGEVLAGKRMVQRKMAAMLGGSGYATPEEKDEMEPDVTSVQTEARVAVAGRKSGQFEGHQNNNKGAYAALHESGCRIAWTRTRDVQTIERILHSHVERLYWMHHSGAPLHISFDGTFRIGVSGAYFK
ncbi:UNVERIFIED_CONTAM: hypothetical protein FKN15_022266 [Acipenser sinensis]